MRKFSNFSEGKKSINLEFLVGPAEWYLTFRQDCLLPRKRMKDQPCFPQGLRLELSGAYLV